MYIESTGRAEGDRAQLETEVISGQRCLRFFYHMYGLIGMGSLNVYIQTKTTRSLVMSLTGNQGNEWKEAYLQINEQLPYKVRNLISSSAIIFPGILALYCIELVGVLI